MSIVLVLGLVWLAISVVSGLALVLTAWLERPEGAQRIDRPDEPFRPFTADDWEERHNN